MNALISYDFSIHLAIIGDNIGYCDADTQQTCFFWSIVYIGEKRITSWNGNALLLAHYCLPVYNPLNGPVIRYQDFLL